MWIKCISCEALARMVYACAATSPHTIDISLLPIGLHDKPSELRKILQTEIDSTDPNRYQAVVLAYGLCGKALEGIKATRMPLVLPRAHDCITLFLGSRERYQEHFNACPGTYWFALDYLERSGRDGTVISLGSNQSTDLQTVYEEYVKKFGEDNARYLLEVMESWQKHYSRAIYLELGLGDEQDQKDKAKELAEKRKWEFLTVRGSLELICRLLHGDWNEDFLTVKPGEMIKMSADEKIITVEPSFLKD